MIERFAQFPQYLADRARTTRLGADVPALIAHPDWASTVPVVLWMHGRTAHKELDPGRYLRWLRAGIGVCAIDLPGHGERFEAKHHTGRYTLDMVEQAVGEIDAVMADLLKTPLSAPADATTRAFDPERLGIGGMSAGGMVTLRRLCDPHTFTAASVEGAAGSLSRMPEYRERYGVGLLEAMDQLTHINGFRPIPLLALHSEADEMVPVEAIREFIDALRERTAAQGGDPDSVRLTTWPTTGAPREHLGFGRVSNDAKNLQTDFFCQHLRATPPQK